MAKAKPTPKPSQLSEERIKESSNEDDNVSEATTSPSESRRSSSQQKKADKPLATPPDSGDGERVSSENESSDDEQDGNDDSSATDEESVASSTSNKRKSQSTDAAPPPTKKAKTTTTKAVQIASKPFIAPKGYEPVILEASDYASEVSSLFDNLSGKQIWHISAPDSVSIDTIKELDIQAALRGEPILKQNGVDYIMQPMAPSKDAVLLPQGTKSTYTQNTTRISKSFNLREMSRKPKSKEQPPVVFTATEEGPKKFIRQQPGGLKMRYHPYGVTAIQEEDVDMADTLQVPAEVEESLPASARATTNGQAHQDDMEVDPKTPEKKKKKKTSTDDASGSTEKKKKKKKRLVDEGL